MKNNESPKSAEILKLVISLNCIQINEIEGTWEKEFSLNSTGITLKESFNPNEHCYEISIFKEVLSLEELYQTKEKILNILEKIALLWPIVTGYSLRYVDIEKKILPKYQSNFDEVESKILETLGKTKKILSQNIMYKIYNEFDKPPLELTLKIYETIKKEPDVWKLLKYYAYSLLDKDCWFVHLYKVRDKLEQIVKKKYNFKKDYQVRKKLNIPQEEWKDFGKILNNYDLRHPGELNGKISEADINKIKLLARKWIITFLNQEFNLSIGW